MPEFKIGNRVMIRKNADVITPQACYIRDHQLPGFVEAVYEQTGRIFIQVYERGVRYMAFVPPDALCLLGSDPASCEAE